jgi:hypothetical protein
MSHVALRVAFDARKTTWRVPLPGTNFVMTATPEVVSYDMPAIESSIHTRVSPPPPGVLVNWRK